MPMSFMASCRDGKARMTPPNPVAAPAAMEARPNAIPHINGRERRYPKRAPDAVAKVVAPPGVIVDTMTNSVSGDNSAMDIHPPNVFGKLYRDSSHN
ncbi:hypothetical protein GCM10027565_21450 [Bordetella tumulicola]